MSRYVLPAILLSALLLRVGAALAFSPQSDVYYYLTESVKTFLSGMNPYLHTYTSVPPALATPGAADVFAYLPFTFLYLIPFYLLGDIRVGFIVADLVVGACLYLYGGRWRALAASVFLFLPFTTVFSVVYLNASLLAMPFIALFFLLESRGRGSWASFSFGVALAASQFSVLILPFFILYARGRRWTEPMAAVIVGLAIVLPFLLLSPSTFLSETVSFQFGRSVSPLFQTGGPFGFSVNPSLSGFTSRAFGVAAPVYLKAAIELVALVPLARVRDLPSLARNSTLFVLLSAFVLPNDFFWAYLELPFMLALFWLPAAGSVWFARDG